MSEAKLRSDLDRTWVTNRYDLSIGSGGNARLYCSKVRVVENVEELTT